MGECGCGEMEVIRDVFSIADKVMVVESYSGCEYCHMGLVTYLHLFDPEEAAEFDLVPTGGFEPDGAGLAQQKGYPIVDQPDLIKAAADLPGLEGYANLQDWLEDYGRELLKKAFYIRLHAEARP